MLGLRRARANANNVLCLRRYHTGYYMGPWVLFTKEHPYIINTLQDFLMAENKVLEHLLSCFDPQPVRRRPDCEED